MHYWLAMLIILGLWRLGAAQTTFVTPFDRVPNFGASPTITAVRSGLWSHATTWSPSRLPTSNDTVGILHHTVTYDAPSATVTTVAIGSGGQLRVIQAHSTRLAVGTLLVAPGGTLEIGTVAFPLPPHVTAEIVIRDLPINTTKDPSQYGTGLLVIDGTLTMVGAPKTPFHRTTQEPTAGTTTLTLDGPPNGWRRGDTLVIPDSRQLTDATKGSASQVEMPTVAVVTGTSVAVTAPLIYGHPGARSSLTGALDFTPHVGNLTRNIVIRSENPTGTRGHVWLTRKSFIHIQYAAFQGLGRTTTATLDDTRYVNGLPTHIGTNQVGRYALHVHHVVSPTMTLTGNVIHGGMVPHTRKWAITLHDSHYGLIRGNIMVNCAGACLMTEDGSESHNVIEDNMAVLATGTGDRFGKGSEATGFWFRGPNNIVRGNVAASIRGSTHNTPHNGYSIWMTDLPAMGKIPNYAGADTTVPGQYTLTNLYSLPLREFVDNEAYMVNVGLTAWWLGTHYHTPRATQESVVKGFKVWNSWSYGWYGYHTHRLVIDGMVTRGSAAGIGCCNAAFTGNDYFTSDFTIQNSDLQGMLDGVIFSTFSSGYQRLRNTRIVPARYGVQMQTLALTGTTGSILPPRNVTLDHVTITKPTPALPSWKSIHFAYSAQVGPRSVVQTDTLTATNHQGVAGADFQAYYPQQAPEFVVPQSVAGLGGIPRFIGAPVAGLTNTQALAEYGVAIAGGIAPCRDQTTHPTISGFTCKGVQ